MLDQDAHARVACETAITKGLCVVIGEVTTHADLDIQRTIRDSIRSIGYNDESIGFDADHALIQVYLKEQSPDIAAGVNHSLEERAGGSDADPFELQGAGDQGMMIGFACRETPELMPLTISLANRLARKLAEVRKSGKLPFLRPDGKTQVTVEYEYGKPRRIEAVVVSAHHAASATQKEIAEGVRQLVIDPVLEGQVVDANTKIMVNPSGHFVLGGPAADAGLTGRKIIVDTYGGVARHGGGAFSGSPQSKPELVSRSRHAHRTEGSVRSSAPSAEALRVRCHALRLGTHGACIHLLDLRRPRPLSRVSEPAREVRAEHHRRRRPAVRTREAERRQLARAARSRHPRADPRH